jgi:hypothetical protein
MFDFKKLKFGGAILGIIMKEIGKGVQLNFLILKQLGSEIELSQVSV